MSLPALRYGRGRCTSCRLTMVPQRQWRSFTHEQREVLIRTGHTKHGAGTECSACYRRALRAQKKESEDT